MFKNQSRFCIDIKPNTNKQMQVKTNHYYYTDNGEISKLSELVLLDDSNDPHESCIICTAIHANRTVSTITRHFFHGNFNCVIVRNSQLQKLIITILFML